MMVYQIASESRLGEPYQVEVRDEKIRCSCLDFRYRQRRCKHIEAVSRREGLPYLLPLINEDPLFTEVRVQKIKDEFVAMSHEPFLYDKENRIQFASADEANWVSYLLTDYLPYLLSWAETQKEKE